VILGLLPLTNQNAGDILGKDHEFFEGGGWRGWGISKKISAQQKLLKKKPCKGSHGKDIGTQGVQELFICELKAPGGSNTS